MNQDHLLRHLAPISDRGWALIDAEALYPEQSFSFRVATPEAAVVLARK